MSKQSQFKYLVHLMDDPAGIQRDAETKQHRPAECRREMAAHVAAMAAQELKQEPGRHKCQGAHQQSCIGLQELQVEPHTRMRLSHETRVSQSRT
ncbi:hypothetical protein [Synechococcus sp. MIT S9509]|uniref:hypothetical protein n=1 Tax=Synechococcus sp. MIT S9509 TaxID=1801630 RepID=UPI001E3F8DA9|nr:hypothetical protein [Synechococcus sp. MIT S9509]